MPCRPRVSLPSIPSTCLIPADTSGNTAHVWIKTVPSKSCLHNAATTTADYGWLHEIIEMQAGSHARGSLPGDSTGVAINRYADWEDAKRGLISRREFVKLHVMADSQGRKIVSCAVTRGRAHDSPVFREMFGKVPDGTGCVMLDAGYDAVKNYKVIRDSGRRPVICIVIPLMIRKTQPCDIPPERF